MNKYFAAVLVPLVSTSLYFYNSKEITYATVRTATNEQECVQLLTEKGFCHWQKEALSNDTVNSVYNWCVQEKNQQKFARQITWKRFHFNLFQILPTNAFPTPQSKELIDLATNLESIAKQYLETEQVKQTEFQIVLAKKESSAQFWHQDNSNKGITIVIPLIDLQNSATRGPTELIPLFGKEIVRATIPKNHFFLFDARMLHRGLGNQDTTLERPIIVIRFDNTATLPPGQTALQTLANRFFYGPYHYCKAKLLY